MWHPLIFWGASPHSSSLSELSRWITGTDRVSTGTDDHEDYCRQGFSLGSLLFGIGQLAFFLCSLVKSVPGLPACSCSCGFSYLRARYWYVWQPIFCLDANDLKEALECLAVYWPMRKGMLLLTRPNDPSFRAVALNHQTAEKRSAGWLIAKTRPDYMP